MHPDLERLIRLQQLEDAAEQARRVIADEPLRQQEFTARIAALQQTLDDERARLAANQAARRDIEKELAMQQGRLSKFKGQLMEVKTNREYQAMLKEIEVAQHEIGKQEDRLLEQMLEFDEITRHVKDAEQRFNADKAAVEAERKALAGQLTLAQAAMGQVAADRDVLAREITPSVLAMFDKLLRFRKLSAVTPVREGRCSACGVRVRPQTVNELRKNEIIFQCDTCQRVIYYETIAAPATPPDIAQE
ncbi:MAG: C4-type zinc ribbon domain-containing protein [Acidobacteria bacterium]|nr:C4-type zinc ribbon domain-containing protein [Acidobacteriota bacterium]